MLSRHLIISESESLNIAIFISSSCFGVRRSVGRSAIFPLSLSLFLSVSSQLYSHCLWSVTEIIRKKIPRTKTFQVKVNAFLFANLFIDH